MMSAVGGPEADPGAQHRSTVGIYLEDLFITPASRGKGYGRMLWAVFRQNEPSINFYHSIGARSMNEGMGMRVDGEDLARLAHSVPSCQDK
ncbi:Uncharacterized protein HZ326_31396 [Fusarium oxysporum f. sp. albedinis]|nr:Uncharacterized protein HZ326_31396 [Fusarium oxysporum f. sp. albedinis]